MYERLARYYDQLHAGLTADVPLALALAQAQPGAVLELGCGSGRLLLPLARAGVAVTGVDNSPAMLARARAHIAAETPQTAERITLVEGDMQRLPAAIRERRYGLVVVPYNTLLHFSEAQAALILRQAAGLLEPHGRVFIDLVNPFAFDDQPEVSGPTLETELRDAESGALVQQWSTTRLDAAAQRVDVRWEFRDTAVTGRSERIEMSYHYLFPHQLELLLRQSGLKLAALWGDYDQRPFAAESERLLALAAAA